MDTATLARAIREAGIDAPIYNIEEMEDGSLVLHLPSRVVTWTPTPGPAEPQPEPTSPPKKPARKSTKGKTL